MAPLPQNNTTRYFFDYVTGNLTTSKEHTVAWRDALPSRGDDQMQDDFRAFLAAIGAVQFAAGWRVLRVRKQLLGTPFSLPVDPFAPLFAFVGTAGGAYPQNRESEEWTWQGRSFTTGRRADFSLFGIANAISPNFRYVVGGTSPAWVGASVSFLNAVEPQRTPRAIDETVPTWYSYVNVQNNSYWEEQIRRG